MKKEEIYIIKCVYNNRFRFGQNVNYADFYTE